VRGADGGTARGIVVSANSVLLEMFTDFAAVTDGAAAISSDARAPSRAVVRYLWAARSCKYATTTLVTSDR
jgi:hypothetical protein